MTTPRSNPFPGMDPWLERQWGDVHQAIITYARDQLRQRLPPGLAARMQDRLFVEYAQEQTRNVYPDLRVIELPGRPPKGLAGTTDGVAVAEPVLVHLRSDPVRESYLELIDTTAGGRVITVVEVLSHANKSGGEGQRLYLQKQEELREARVNLVEIDLLRGGKRVTNAPPDRLSRELRTPYQICALRGERPEIAEVYPIGLRSPIPSVRIPLRSEDPDVPLDVQALVDQAYENGDYVYSINYKADPDPPLDPEDAKWAEELLKSKGLR